MTAYHPQSNGSTEQVNQKIKHYLWLFINYHPSDRKEWLPLMEFSYNDRVHLSTKMSLFYVDNGCHLFKGTEPLVRSDNITAQQFVDSMVKILTEALSALKKAAEDMKCHYDKNWRNAIESKPGDKIWLEGTNLSSDQLMKKLGNKWFGLLTVSEKVGDGAYKLDMPQTWKHIHNIFNESLLTSYKEPIFDSQPQNTRPLPVIVGSCQIFNTKISKWRSTMLEVRWKKGLSRNAKFYLHKDLEQPVLYITVYSHLWPFETVKSCSSKSNMLVSDIHYFFILGI